MTVSYVVLGQSLRTSVYEIQRMVPDQTQDVIPYVLSDWLSFLATSFLSPSIYVILVYFISHLRTDDLAARLFTTLASVGW